VEKNRKIILTVAFLGIISYTILSGHFLHPFFPSPAIVIINVGMNWCYHYEWPIIESEGNTTINKIVDDTAQFGTDPTRLIRIADKLSENFTDMYWPSPQNFFCYYTYSDGKSEWTWCPPFGGIFGSNPLYYGYVYDKKGRVRARLSNDLNYNPKWIAYQKTGACEALSIFFNETANRSGFVSRIVCSNGANHTWNEVRINGEWKYYDVQLYGQVKNTNNSTFWFGNRSEYGEKSGFNRSDITKFGVYVFDLQHCGNGENITQYYEL
jgi:hypothetical protein